LFVRGNGDILRGASYNLGIIDGDRDSVISIVSALPVLLVLPA
jgi:hypothetical protein